MITGTTMKVNVSKLPMTLLKVTANNITLDIGLVATTSFWTTSVTATLNALGVLTASSISAAVSLVFTTPNGPIVSTLVSPSPEDKHLKATFSQILTKAFISRILNMIEGFI